MDAEKRHKCVWCNYATKRGFDLKRHQNAKHKDKFMQESINQNFSENVSPKIENVSPFSENVPPNSENVSPNSENVPCDQESAHESVPKKNFYCKKCYKGYNHKKYLVNHETKCKGIDNLTCPRCMVSFTTRKHKSRHIKADTCKARSIIHARTPPNIQNIQNIQNMINNNNTNNTNNTQNINTQNNVGTQNIIINNFGTERIDHITYEDVMNMLMQGVNTIPKYIEKKHFDKDFPENHNIIYTKENKCQVFEQDAWKEKNLSLVSSKLVKENSGALLLFCNDNEIRLAHDIQNEEIFDFIKYKLMKIYHKDDDKYKEIYNMVKDIIMNT
jgi:hypothetical protein